jgi:Cdc6-like AAA superfamily ATPase
LENELSIITGRGWISLSAEQKKVLDDIEMMQMTGDGDHHDGSIVLMTGPYGSGKTVLGIEAGRILRSKRQEMHTGQEVELTFCAPGYAARSLMETLRQNYFKIEKMGNIQTIEEIHEMYQLGQYDNYDGTLHILAKIGQGLSQSRKQHVIILDELPNTKDYTKIKKYPNVDMVVLAKADLRGEKKHHHASQ